MASWPVEPLCTKGKFKLVMRLPFCSGIRTDFLSRRVGPP
jgi:hypothetical protein